MVCRRLVLPPTCTKVIPSTTWTSRAKQLFTLPTKKKGKGGKGKAGKAAKAKEEQSDESVSVADDHQAPKGKQEEGEVDEEQQQVSQQASSQGNDSAMSSSRQQLCRIVKLKMHCLCQMSLLQLGTQPMFCPSGIKRLDV